MKKIILIILIVLNGIILCSCDTLLPYGRKYEIFPQAGTDWITEDESMPIHVDDDGCATMIVNINGEVHKIRLGGLHGMIVGRYSDDSCDTRREEWYAFYHQKWFSIKVDYSEFLEKGTKIRFYKVEE